MTLSPAKQRMPLVDMLKALACLAIVLHHLAFYGPMSDVAMVLAPQLIAWLYDYGRMAVQLFLVMSGFLTAGQLAQWVRREESVPLFSTIWQRYLRLAIPYVVALLVALVGAAMVRPWMHHDSVPGSPQPAQLLSHVLMLQGWLDHEALSAGVWYVAIDLQLFAIAAAILWVSQGLVRSTMKLGVRSQDRAGQAMVWLQSLTFCGVVASLFFFNLHPGLDHTGLYFFGSYGLGLLTRWAVQYRRISWIWVALLLVASLALLIDFRMRILVAVGTALLLGCSVWQGGWHWTSNTVLAWLARISYSVFLIHFPVCLVMNALWHHWFPSQPWVNLLGMFLALGLSLGAGHLFWGWVESRGSARLMGILVPGR